MVLNAAGIGVSYRTAVLCPNWGFRPRPAHAFSRHVEACPGVELGIPDGAEGWLAQKYGPEWATPIVRGTRAGVRDLGCRWAMTRQ